MNNWIYLPLLCSLLTQKSTVLNPQGLNKYIFHNLWIQKRCRCSHSLLSFICVWLFPWFPYYSVGKIGLITSSVNYRLILEPVMAHSHVYKEQKSCGGAVGVASDPIYSLSHTSFTTYIVGTAGWSVGESHVMFGHIGHCGIELRIQIAV